MVIMKHISLISEKDSDYELKESYEEKYIRYLEKRYGKKRALLFSQPNL